jgi:ppGpp synthetase/RelA/SpoT-type nucleotidyltranferase
VAQNTKSSIIDRGEFLRSYNFTEEQFKGSELDWSLLEQIYVRHISMVGELQTTANYISQRLQSVPTVHSLNVRIKHEEHLIAKIIRKKLQHPELAFDVASYGELITDLIGIRALHLFKDEWRMIHDFITATWDLHETPIAYVRSGDPAALLAAFSDAKFRVEEHPFGYRSIHYLIESRPAKCTQFAELQVRTIFEEGWSEIDHRVRYPRQSDDPYLAEFLTIFNRLAGSADEMGTFIKSLSSFISEQAHKLAERELEVVRKEEELKTAVSKLRISEGEKSKLQHRIDELRKSSPVVPGVSVAGEWLRHLDIWGTSRSTLGNTLKGIDIGALSRALSHIVPCANCNKLFVASPLEGSAPQLCPDCRK